MPLDFSLTPFICPSNQQHGPINQSKCLVCNGQGMIITGLTANLCPRCKGTGLY